MPVIGDTSECPRYHIDTTARQFQRLRRAFDRGFLPFAGGYLEQPQSVLAMLELYDEVS